MTERLSTLLHREAEGLDVPPPATGAVLERGRRERRVRQGGVALGAAAAAVVIGGTAVLAGGVTASNDSAPDPAAPVGEQPVFSVGTTVYHDGPERSATIDDKAIKSLFYPSAGVLVRHGNNPWSDGGGPQRSSLVAPDGTVAPLDLVTEEAFHASDPDEPYVVYAENVDGVVEAVVHDVAADEEAARVEVTESGQDWFPVALDGDTLYVQDGYQGQVFAVDWAAGDVETSPLASLWGMAEGRAVEARDGRSTVVDAASGETLLTSDGPGYLTLSPDGRYARLVDEDLGRDLTVYSVESGEQVTIEGAPQQWGWTTDGSLFRVGEKAITTCDPDDGSCAEQPFDGFADIDVSELEEGLTCRSELVKGERVESCDLPAIDPGEVKLGGVTYES